MIRLKKRHVGILVTSIALVMVLACGCLLDRSGTGPPGYTFGVAPREVVCQNGHDTVTVSWSVNQPADCTWESPGLRGCDPVGEYFFGCDEGPPRCHAVDVTANGAPLDPPVGSRESSGSRTMTITEATSFALSTDGAVREVIDVTVLGFPVVDYSNVYAINRACNDDGTISADSLPLQDFASQCVNVGDICNTNAVDIVIDSDDDLLPPIPLEPGQCLSDVTGGPVGQPREWFVIPDPATAGFENPCNPIELGVPGAPGGDAIREPSTGGDGSDTSQPELDPLEVVVTYDGCGEYNDAAMMCIHVTDATMSAEPTPAPTLPPGSGGSPGGEPVAACGSVCATDADCVGLGPNPACVEGFCYDGQTCNTGPSSSGGEGGEGGDEGGGKQAECGNGVVEAGEACDGNNNGSCNWKEQYCTNSCSCDTLE